METITVATVLLSLEEHEKHCCLFAPTCELLPESILEGCRSRLNTLSHKTVTRSPDQSGLAEAVRAIDSKSHRREEVWQADGVHAQRGRFSAAFEGNGSALCWSDRAVRDQVGCGQLNRSRKSLWSMESRSSRRPR